MIDLPDDYICEGQISLWDLFKEKEPEFDISNYMNEPIEDE